MNINFYVEELSKRVFELEKRLALLEKILLNTTNK